MSSHLLGHCLSQSGSFNFNEVQLSNYLIHHVFGLLHNNSFLYQGRLDFLLSFSKGFTVISFTFRSVMHFELIFMKGVRSVSRTFFFLLYMGMFVYFSTIC